VLHKTFIAVLFLFIALFSQSALAQQDILVLKIILNEMDLGEDFVVMSDEGDVLVRMEFLKSTTGLREGLGDSVQYSGESYLSLKSVRELEFFINEETLSLEIKVPSYHFNQHTVDLSRIKTAQRVIYSRENSAFLNYGLNYEARDSTMDFSTELGVKVSNYFATSTFNYSNVRDDENGVRLFTSVTRDDRERLTRLIYGDFSTSSGVLGSSRFLGGINFSKDYRVDPYFFRYPSFALSGALTTPSEVDIYSHGILVRKLKLDPGEFILENIPLSAGFGNTEVVIKDIYGNERSFSDSVYFSTRLLKEGLHEYNYGIGIIREDIGEESFSYAEAAVQAFHAVGLSDSFKGGYTLEASNKVINAGPTVTLGLSSAGILETAVAVSNAGGKTGVGASLEHFFTSRYFSSTLSFKSLSREYSNLSMEPSQDKAFFEFNGALGVNSRGLGSLLVKHSISRLYDGFDTSSYAINYSRPLTRHTSLLIIASKTKEEGAEDIDEVHFVLNMNFGSNAHGNISYKNNNSGNANSVSVRRDLPVGTGFGFNANATEFEDYVGRTAGLSYQNDYGIYGVEYSERDGDDSYNLSLAGGVGYIDGSAFLSRPLTDSFTRVNVGDLEGVRVYHFSHEVGRTDKDGNLIIPIVNSYRDNRVDIEIEDIPVNYHVPELYKYINPPPRSGSTLSFEAHKVQALTGRIYTFVDGEKVPAGPSPFIVILYYDGSIIEGLVGRNGEFYVENVPSGRFLVKVIHEGTERLTVIDIPDSDEMWVDLGEVTAVEIIKRKDLDDLLRQLDKHNLPELELNGQDDKNMGKFLKLRERNAKVKGDEIFIEPLEPSGRASYEENSSLPGSSNFRVR
jgi:outer membrane usher protein